MNIHFLNGKLTLLSSTSLLFCCFLWPVDPMIASSKQEGGINEKLLLGHSDPEVPGKKQPVLAPKCCLNFDWQYFFLEELASSILIEPPRRRHSEDSHPALHHKSLYKVPTCQNFQTCIFNVSSTCLRWRGGVQWITDGSNLASQVRK